MVEGINDINNNKYNKKASSVISQPANENASIFGNNSEGMPSLIEGFEKRTEKFNKSSLPAQKSTNIKKEKVENNNSQKTSSTTKADEEIVIPNKPKDPPSLVENLKQQDKKLSNATKKPAFEMTNTEKETEAKLNKEQQSRVNHQKAIEAKEEAEKARQNAISRWEPHIKKYGIDVTGMNAEQIENAVRAAREAERANRKRTNPVDDYRRLVDEFNEPFDAINDGINNTIDNTINKGSNFRKTTVYGDKEGYTGNIGGTNFKLYSRENDFERGSQYLGSIGGQRVNVEERKDYEKINGKKYYGKIGNNDVSINSQKSLYADKVVYNGTYKGQNFSVTVKKNFISVRDAEVMQGSYGNQQVEIKSQNNFAGGSRGIQGNKIPKNFSDVAALLMVITSEN